MSYKKENPRITVKIIDNKTEVEIGEIKNRNHMDVGELFTDFVGNSIIEGELKAKKTKLLPDEVMIIAIGIFKKV